jgi:hypothetical protein
MSCQAEAAFEAAVESWNVQAIMDFLVSTPDLAKKPFGDNQFTILHVAVSHLDEAVIAAALKAGADPNAVDGSGQTPLHMLEALDADGESELSKDDQMNRFRCVQRLASSGANLNAMDGSGRKPAIPQSLLTHLQVSSPKPNATTQHQGATETSTGLDPIPTIASNATQSDLLSAFVPFPFIGRAALVVARKMQAQPAFSQSVTWLLPQEGTTRAGCEGAPHALVPKQPSEVLQKFQDEFLKLYREALEDSAQAKFCLVAEDDEIFCCGVPTPPATKAEAVARVPEGFAGRTKDGAVLRLPGKFWATLLKDTTSKSRLLQAVQSDFKQKFGMHAVKIDSIENGSLVIYAIVPWNPLMAFALLLTALTEVTWLKETTTIYHHTTKAVDLIATCANCQKTVLKDGDYKTCFWCWLADLAKEAEQQARAKWDIPNPIKGVISNTCVTKFFCGSLENFIAAYKVNQCRRSGDYYFIGGPSVKVWNYCCNGLTSGSKVCKTPLGASADTGSVTACFHLGGGVEGTSPLAFDETTGKATLKNGSNCLPLQLLDFTGSPIHPKAHKTSQEELESKRKQACGVCGLHLGSSIVAIKESRYCHTCAPKCAKCKTVTHDLCSCHTRCLSCRDKCDQGHQCCTTSHYTPPTQSSSSYSTSSYSTSSSAGYSQPDRICSNCSGRHTSLYTSSTCGYCGAPLESGCQIS